VMMAAKLTVTGATASAKLSLGGRVPEARQSARLYAVTRRSLVLNSVMMEGKLTGMDVIATARPKPDSLATILLATLPAKKFAVMALTLAITLAMMVTRPTATVAIQSVRSNQAGNAQVEHPHALTSAHLSCLLALLLSVRVSQNFSTTLAPALHLAISVLFQANQRLAQDVVLAQAQP
jgi:hypothetical protein